MLVFELVLLFLIVFTGAFIQGISGFGIGLVMMAFLPFFLTVKESTLLVISLLVVASTLVVIKNARYIEWDKVQKFFLFALLGRVVAFFTLTHFGELEILQVYLGIFLVGMVVYMAIRERVKDQHMKPVTWVQTSTLGYLGGFIGGLFGVGGPFFVFYFLIVLAQHKYKYLANVQFVTLLVSVFSLSLHAANGDLQPSFLSYFLIGTIAVALGTLSSFRLFDRVNQVVVRRLAMVLVLLAALNLVFLAR